MEGYLHDSGTPWVILDVFGPSGEKSIKFVLDTGFTGSITLTNEDISDLGLGSAGSAKIKLADGSIQKTTVYGPAYIRWGGGYTETYAFLTKGDPLIGMDLLSKSTIIFQGKGKIIRIDQ